MIRFSDVNEVLQYRVRKSKGPIFFMIIFMPIWLYFGSIFLSPLYKIFFLWDMTFNSSKELLSEAYIAGLVGLVLFLPIAIIIPLSYLMNRLVITDQRIYIRKGIGGKIQILNLSDICSFQHVVSRGRNGTTNHRILFYLSCGERAKTGELYATLFSLQDLLAVLREKFEGRGYSNQELKQMKEQNGEKNGPITKRNVFALLLPLVPFLLALIITCLYFSGGF